MTNEAEYDIYLKSGQPQEIGVLVNLNQKVYFTTENATKIGRNAFSYDHRDSLD